MRYAWVDSEHNPRDDLAAQFGIDGWFFDPRDAFVTKPYLETWCEKKGRVAGIYLGHAWGEFGSTPESFVLKALSWVKPLRKSNSFPKVQWDLEQHDPEFILRVLRLWRASLPGQETSWTLEPGQGGLFGPEFITEITQKLRVRVVPQLFGGPMKPYDARWVLEDLTSRGWPPHVISFCHDGALLHAGWSGYAFTMNRIDRYAAILAELQH